MENQKPNRFENSKIYKIVDNTTRLIYVGSTTKELNTRLIQHKCAYKRYLSGKYGYMTSYEIIKNLDYDIKLIKSYVLENKFELLAKESFYIKKLNCINKVIVGRTRAEYRIENRIELYAKQNAVCICSCGCSYTKCNKLRHLESKKHIKLIAKINDPRIV